MKALSAPQVARRAELRYVSDEAPGLRRRRAGRGFAYLRSDGRPVRDRQTLERIRSLAIPPAWTDVWICPDPDGHLQATGRDARGRKQYRYHPRWRETRDTTKFDRMVDFGRALPRLRRRLERDLARRGLPREKVIATVVRLLDSSRIRIGNPEYARENRSYGLTTLRDRHVEVEGGRIRFHFKGKSGREHKIDVRDRRLAAIVRRCQDLPGQELFRYVDEAGETRTLESSDVNGYLQAALGDQFTTKDFRTWSGTVLAAVELGRQGAADGEAEARHRVVEAVRVVAGRLGNTAAVCRRCYVHPGLIEGYLAGRVIAACEEPDEHCERAVLSLLESLSRAA